VRFAQNEDKDLGLIYSQAPDETYTLYIYEAFYQQILSSVYLLGYNYL
jgi:hypothetical protein